MTNKTHKEMALLFHTTYETLAPKYGYETRKDTKVFDPESKNGQLMIEVCDIVGNQIKLNTLNAIKEWAEEEVKHTKRHSKGNYADGRVEALQDLLTYIKEQEEIINNES